MLSLEVHDDVTRIVLSTPVSRAAGYGVSAYFTRGVLVDSGFAAVGGDLARWLDATPLIGAILTHAHEDHAGNVELLARRRVPIAASLHTLDALRALAPLHLYRRIVWGTPPALSTPITPFTPDALRLVATPGHSVDHHVVWDAERETMFGGDLFLGVKVRVAHCWENPRLLVESLRLAAALGPKRFFDAHRGLVPTPVAALRAKADWLEETVSAIARRIAEGWPDRAITRDVLGREDRTHYLSRGGMSKVNLVRAVRR